MTKEGTTQVLFLLAVAALILGSTEAAAWLVLAGFAILILGPSTDRG